MKRLNHWPTAKCGRFLYQIGNPEGGRESLPEEKPDLEKPPVLHGSPDFDKLIENIFTPEMVDNALGDLEGHSDSIYKPEEARLNSLLMEFENLKKDVVDFLKYSENSQIGGEMETLRDMARAIQEKGGSINDIIKWPENYHGRPEIKAAFDAFMRSEVLAGDPEAQINEEDIIYSEEPVKSKIPSNESAQNIIPDIDGMIADLELGKGTFDPSRFSGEQFA